MTQTSQDLVLVTGGGGFLGSAICRKLIDAGYRVRSFSRNTYPSLTQMGVECISGDISDLTHVKRAVAGVSGVIHTAAKAGIWGPKQDFYQANVVGTQNVIQACLEHKISRLVHTSSPSVVFSGKDIAGAGESELFYPEKFLASYPKSKMLAEKLVLAVKRDTGLVTVALRPHLIWGAGDPHFLPRLVEKAKAGRLRKVGHLKNRVDVIHVENAAQAHIQALERLTPTSALCGQAYFLGQEEPVNLWEFVNALLSCCAEKEISRTISASFAYSLGSLCEGIYGALSLEKEPPMTRFLALQLSKSHFFSHKKAESDFSYFPQISTQEGLRKLKQSHFVS